MRFGKPSFKKLKKNLDSATTKVRQGVNNAVKNFKTRGVRSGKDTRVGSPGTGTVKKIPLKRNETDLGPKGKGDRDVSGEGERVKRRTSDGYMNMRGPH
jgi:hypothetical protein